MNCEKAGPLLEAYADGEASPRQQAEVSRHLEGCPSCARQLRWLRAMSRGLESLPPPPMPAGLTEELLRLARGRRPTPSFWQAWGMPFWRGLAPAMAFGAAAFMLTHFSSAGKEELGLNEVLAAHARYALTMPAADRETLYAGLAAEEKDDL